jgi:hypothetical protein
MHPARHLSIAGRALIGCVALGACGTIRIAPAPIPVSATSDSTHAAPPRGMRFYRGIPVGSEAAFNPFSLIVNGGFDQLRVASANRHVFDLDYALAARGAWQSIVHPDAVIRTYTWDRFVKRQLLPMSGKSSGGGQWLPNYQLHLMGGGMTGVRMTEWFIQHDVSHPELAAAATVTAWHLMTEMIEHQNGVPSADAVADLLIFDPAAFLLWRNDALQRAFSGRIEMTNWPGQAAIVAPTATIQNMHQTAMMRLATPWSGTLRPMTTFGGSFLVGLSRKKGETDWVSVAGGWDPTENPVTDPVTGEKTVTLNPNIGLFYDRGGSLLAAAHARLNRRELITLNVYPGVVHFGSWSPGLFAHVLDNGRFRFGIVPRFGLGTGVE